MLKKIIALSILFSINAYSLEIKNEESYVVKKGDTLWDISEHFLNDPWEWRKIWSYNPQIENPHLIYPDDIVHLIYKDGKPQLVLEKKDFKVLNLNDGAKEIKKKISDSLPAVNTEKIKELESSLVLLKNKPSIKIVKSKYDNLIHKNGDLLYVYSENELNIGSNLSILTFKQSLEKDLNVYDISGEVKIKNKDGNIYLVEITKNLKRIKVGDFLENIDFFDENKKIYPSTPIDRKISGKIIYTGDKINLKKDDVVILNKGLNDKIQAGNILKVQTDNENIEMDNKIISIKGNEKGYLFVYKVENNFSYAIIVRNEELINLNDKFYSPL